MPRAELKSRRWPSGAQWGTRANPPVSGVIPTGQPEPVVDRIDVGVAQGFVEQSNVNPVLEMTRLIMVQRSFENAMALTRDTETAMDDAVKTLGGG